MTWPTEGSNPPPAKHWVRRWARKVLILGMFALIPPGVAWVLAPRPGERSVHIEAFRYGKRPAVIRCTRGDILRLTFSALDTGHSFFVEEFDIDAKITPGRHEVAVYRVKNPTVPPQWTREVTVQAVVPGALGWLFSKVHYRCHVWCGPMHAFEHGNLILEPNLLLWAGSGLVLGIFSLALWSLWFEPGLLGLSRVNQADDNEAVNVAVHIPGVKPILAWGPLQYVLLLASGAVFYFVVLSALMGTKVAGRNFGVIFTWIIWLFLLVVIVVPWGGRLWCLICPIPALGEFISRGGRLRPRAPQQSPLALHSASFSSDFMHQELADRGSAWGIVTRTLILLAIGTFSPAIVAIPRLTGWILLTLLLLATSLGVIAGYRAFCLKMCPVASFLGAYGQLAKLGVRPADRGKCQKCRSHACQHGNERGWPCPYKLRMGELRDDLECGWCLECFKSCPFDNVSVRFRAFGSAVRFRHWIQAWQACVLAVLAIAYSLVYLGPWPELRDCVNLVDEFNPRLFLTYAACLWLTAVVGAPGALFLLASLGSLLARKAIPATTSAKIAAKGVLPLGLAIWAAFVWHITCANGSFVLQVLSDPLGWGWNLFGTANVPWRQIWPEGIPFVQVLFMLMGWYYALKVTGREWFQRCPSPYERIAGTLPVWLALGAMALAMVKFFAD